MTEILSEIVPLSSRDSFLIVERHKNAFTYPLHRHREYELNFIQYGKGVRRIVGDNISEIGDYDLVLIASENLEHTWEQGDCQSKDIREITIQFSPDLFSESVLGRNQFVSISKMFKKAENGISFPIEAIMKVYSILDIISSQKDSFLQYLSMLQLLYELSHFEAEVLSSSTFSHAARDTESRRVRKVREYIDEHYTENLDLDTLAGLVGMSSSAFSRFFKLRTGDTVINYIIGIRLGAAARALVDSTKTISEICYACGFNNLSNFNRIFKARRGVSPREFRELYKKQRIII